MLPLSLARPRRPRAHTCHVPPQGLCLACLPAPTSSRPTPTYAPNEPAVVQRTLHGLSPGHVRAPHPAPPAPSRPTPLHPPGPGSPTGPTSWAPLAAARPPAANPGDCHPVHDCWFQQLRATVTNGFPSDVRTDAQPAPPLAPRLTPRSTRCRPTAHPLAPPR